MDRDLTALYVEHVESLARRTGETLERLGYDGLAIHSGSLVKKSEFDDQYWPLRLVPQFDHFAHLPWPECALFVRPGRKPELLALRDRSFWERPPEPDWSFLGAALDVVMVDRAEDIAERLRGKGKIAFVGENRARAADWGVAAEHTNPAPLMTELEEIRVFKTPYEIRCLAEANRIAARGHRAVRAAFDDGVRSELKLHLAYLDATGQDDHETPYKNIVAVGESAAILHHVNYAKEERRAESLLLDAGATFNGYASDITRTYAGRGEEASVSLFAELVRRLEAMQQALCASAEVGRPYEALHDEAHARLAEVLVDTGLVKMSATACVETGVSRRFLPHGLGHSLGLQTHDVGCARIRPREENAWLRNTRVIEPGQVFTIEPGLYFIDTFMEELKGGPHGAEIDWAKVDALAPFGGIRIEDDVVVLADRTIASSQNLTREAL